MVGVLLLWGLCGIVLYVVWLVLRLVFGWVGSSVWDLVWV